jgi:hypothetical protein
LLALGASGAALLLAGVALGAGAAVAAGDALLGGGYAAHLLLDDPPLDGRAALVAAGLALAAELAYWSIELRGEVTQHVGEQLRRFVAEIVLCLGGLALAAVVLAAADLGRPGGVAIEAVGVGAAAALAWLALAVFGRAQRSG